MAVLALASINLVGPIGVLAFVAATGVLIATHPLFNLRQLIRFSPLLLLPLLAICSAMWSDAPQRTMRAALQLLLTIAATIVVCRNLRADRFVLAFFIGFLVTVLTVLPGVPGSLASGYPLSASWGSKNSVGFAGYLLATLSLAVVVDSQQPGIARLIALPAGAAALLVAHLAQSGGTTASLAITLIVFPSLAMLGRFSLPVRIGLAGFALLLSGLSLLFLNSLETAVTNFRTNVLNKDATLTGRTYLWDFAEKLSANHPILGNGYFAFWRQGNIDAEGLWRWGGIASRAGFNFHNAFVEMRVDLGLLGLSVLVVTCVVVLAVALVRQVVAPSVPLACLVGLTCVNYFRSYVETGLIAPFSLVTVLWLATVLYALPRRDEAGSAALPDGGRFAKATVPRRDAWWSGKRRDRWSGSRIV